MKVAVYVGTSVDGFIARPGGEVDFLDSAEPVEDDFGFAEFLASVDALVMGRNTFDWVLDAGVDWPYGDKRVMVMTSRDLSLPPDLASVVTPTSLAPSELLEDLAAQGIERVYVDGGKTIQSFLREGLVDELTVTQVPVLIGTGIPLFGELPHDLHLDHLETISFPNGLVQTHYQVRGN